MRSRLRRLGGVLSPLYGFGCGSDLATGHPGRREIVAPGGCHANPDQAPELLGLCRIGRDLPAFLGELDAALLDPGPKAWRCDAVRGESWAARLEEVRLLFADAIGARP